jgi:hypothetical protein
MMMTAVSGARTTPVEIRDHSKQNDGAAGTARKQQARQAHSPPPAVSEGAKMPPGRPETAVASGVVNLAGPNRQSALESSMIARVR